MKKIKKKYNIYYIKTNRIGFESNSNIINIKEYYFNNILKPSEKVINRINQIYNNYNLKDNNYISLHIRCGDANMSNNNEQSIDKRINLSDDIYNQYNDIINNFYNNYGENLKMIIHSDSQIFKNEICRLNKNIINLDIDIKHIAENIGINNVDSYISTIAEFYIISKANKIFSPKNYSGFSHIASFINSIKLYCHYDNEHFKLINDKNIYII